MNRTHITITLLKKLSLGSGEKFADTEVRNLQVWVGKQTITFYLVRKFEGRQHFVKIGNWPEMTLEEARQDALGRLGAMLSHQEAIARNKLAPTIGEAFDYFLTHCQTENTRKSATSALRCLASFRKIRISALTLEDVIKAHKALKATPQRANLAVKYLSTSMNRFMRSLKLEFKNPISHFEFYEQIPRDRYLTPEEAPRFIAALNEMQNTRYALEVDAIRMLMLTGARKTNVCTMRLEEIHNGLWIIPKGKFKAGRTHTIVLGDQELNIIEARRRGRTEGPVFEKKANIPLRDVTHVLKLICQKAQIENFHPHDLRRTLATWMLSTGTDIAIVSKKLGHSDIRITETVYAHILPDISRQATDIALEAMRKGAKI